MPNASQYLKNPVPHLQEAQKAASRILQLQKQLLTIRTERATVHQVRKIGLAVTSGVFALMALVFGFGWASIALHESGWSTGRVALISFVLFTLIAGLFARFFLNSLTSGKSGEDH
jgi:sterol desaturase/sphingolipid hydroxylase (fatty acid hydroxylase superfamily)